MDQDRQRRKDCCWWKLVSSN